MKAEKVFTIYGKHSNVVTYRYRGKTYDVEYATDWTYCTTPARVQHENAQRRIDELIDQETQQTQQSGHEFNINEIFDILGWD